MPTNTPNFNLVKPTQEEFYNVDVPNNNMDIIDRLLKEFQDAITSGATEKELTVLKEALTLHLEDKLNPHGVTKSQVGLSEVQNYGVATVAEAKGGKVNNKYMTPLRLAEAIPLLAPKNEANGYAALNAYGKVTNADGSTPGLENNRVVIADVDISTSPGLSYLIDVAAYKDIYFELNEVANGDTTNARGLYIDFLVGGVKPSSYSRNEDGTTGMSSQNAISLNVDASSAGQTRNVFINSRIQDTENNLTKYEYTYMVRIKDATGGASMPRKGFGYPNPVGKPIVSHIKIETTTTTLKSGRIIVKGVPR